MDIIKDRLYTAAPRSRSRRSAQTALYRIADALARMLAPVLVFTADEIWENLPSSAMDEAHALSVHLAEFPKASGEKDEALLSRWTKIFEVRDHVLRALEEARNAKLIGSSLEAHVALLTDTETYQLLQHYRDDLRYIFIVSQVDIALAGEAEAPVDGVKVTINHAEGEKCERCWNYSTRVGESSRYPSACERCVVALAEIEQEAVA
jgi:isoleucyl-tRNA synthetase